MASQQKHRIKAMFLLVVFSLNMLTGFACAVGVDMEYNVHHHKQSKMDHATEKERQHWFGHYYMATAANFGDASAKNDCCFNNAVKFMLLAKTIPTYNANPKFPAIVLVFTSPFTFQSLVNPQFAIHSRFRSVQRSYFFTNMNIFLAIESFRI
jgi:hypothetical protein